MRPLRLEVEGFTSFRDRACLDFAGLDLFAITGPTGAGKSSLIDAMVLALYGQVPRVGDRYKQLISHGAERMSVRLDFQVGSDTYRVARTIRESGASQARLERLSNGSPTGLADRVKDIQEQVERIVGLDYDAFTRSVVLPQGQFDAFLKGRPDERRRMLVSLLNLGVYERMHAVVNRQASDARREAEFVASQIAADFAAATAADLAARRAELQRVSEEAERLEDAAVTLETGFTIAQALRIARRDADGMILEIDAEARRRRTAEEAVESVTARRGTLDARAAELAERREASGFDESRFLGIAAARPVLEALLDARSSLTRIASERKQRETALETKRSELERLEADLGKLEAASDAARRERDTAREALDAVRMRHAAHAIRARLKRGDPCPICERPLETVRRGTVSGLQEAESRLEKTEAASEAARVALERHRLALERMLGTIERLEGECRDLEARTREARLVQGRVERDLKQAGFGDFLDAPAEALESIRRELRSLEQARAVRDRLAAEARDLEGERVKLERALVEAQSQVEAAAQRLKQLTVRRGRAEERVVAEQDRLRALARHEGWEEIAGGDAAEVEPSTQASLPFLSDRRPRQPEPAAIDSDEQGLLAVRRQSLQRALAAAHARRGGLEKEVAALTAALARAAELREQKRTLEARAALATSLAQHLQANQFLAYVQEEALRVLAEDGSRHMTTLSQGRYSLECDGQDFCVVDHWNGDLRRSVKTLSGGETFLASLSLALALAGRFADLSAEGRSGEALQSLFLDEGFGTLDAEALEVVVSAIEALQGGERMIGVVTHIPELAERLPGRIQVSSKGGCASVSVC
jgi:DNA repair protein SbcC/Rad50